MRLQLAWRDEAGIFPCGRDSRGFHPMNFRMFLPCLLALVICFTAGAQESAPVSGGTPTAVVEAPANGGGRAPAAGESREVVPASAESTVPDTAEFAHTQGNPWLFIVIGLLLVTGILLYVDPRIFH